RRIHQTVSRTLGASGTLPKSPSEFAFGEFFVGFDVFGAGAGDDVGGEGGGWAAFVPAGGFQPVADELFVERRLAVARFVLVGGPEAGAVGGEDFVDEQHFAAGVAELELRVGDDDPPCEGVFDRLRIDVQTSAAKFGRGLFSDDFAHLPERNVDVVP